MSDAWSVKLALELLGGLLCLAGGLYWWRAARRARRRAVATTATIVDSDVHRGTEGYYPRIRYRYNADGHERTSDQIFPTRGRTSGKRRWAKRLVARFPPGASVTAWYLPEAPQRAFLMNTAEPLILVPIGLGVALLALAVGQLIGLL